MEGKRLYRSRKDRMICGVCGGIAKYFNIDPTLVRLAFVLISMGAGSGVLAYIVAAIIIPDDPEENEGVFLFSSSSWLIPVHEKDLVLCLLLDVTMQKF